MSDLKQELEQYLRSTEDIQRRIREYKESPSRILIGESIILKGLSVVLLGASALLAPKMALVAGVIKLGGKILGVLAKRENKEAE